MKSNHIAFNLERSLERIDSILYDSTSYEEADDIPDIKKLTFTNGKYVKCSAIFIDLRGSSQLIEREGKLSKSLARLYRAYISEIVAIVNSFKTCKEINIIGDCVSAIFAGNIKDANSPAIEALKSSAMCNSMMKVLNIKYKKKWENFSEIKAGIGIAYGQALVIKAGFSGSSIHDLIYMGDVVNKASKMCSLASKKYSEYPICVTEEVYSKAAKYIANKDTQQTFQDFLRKTDDETFGTIYIGNFQNTKINNWVKDNR